MDTAGFSSFIDIDNCSTKRSGRQNNTYEESEDKSYRLLTTQAIRRLHQFFSSKPLKLQRKFTFRLRNRCASVNNRQVLLCLGNPSPQLPNDGRLIGCFS